MRYSEHSVASVATLCANIYKQNLMFHFYTIAILCTLSFPFLSSLSLIFFHFAVLVTNKVLACSLS